ncbi:hypothetical protein pipiens_004328 [Culex pipiens pipiens]|uniref:Uncharacterized protein n=1 Tax=Culex pipiens pipiens TaxID=38569 RepID=A0ABD1CJX9_CULPP
MLPASLSAQNLGFESQRVENYRVDLTQRVGPRFSFSPNPEIISRLGLTGWPGEEIIIYSWRRNNNKERAFRSGDSHGLASGVRRWAVLFAVCFGGRRRRRSDDDGLRAVKESKNADSHTHTRFKEESGDLK